MVGTRGHHWISEILSKERLLTSCTRFWQRISGSDRHTRNCLIIFMQFSAVQATHMFRFLSFSLRCFGVEFEICRISGPEFRGITSSGAVTRGGTRGNLTRICLARMASQQSNCLKRNVKGKLQNIFFALRCVLCFIFAMCHIMLINYLFFERNKRSGHRQQQQNPSRMGKIQISKRRSTKTIMRPLSKMFLYTSFIFHSVFEF